MDIRIFRYSLVLLVVLTLGTGTASAHPFHMPHTHGHSPATVPTTRVPARPRVGVRPSTLPAIERRLDAHYGQPIEPAWRHAIERSVRTSHGRREFIAPIREATRLAGSRYPEALVAGLIIHESWARADHLTPDCGYGYAQITPDRVNGRRRNCKRHSLASNRRFLRQASFNPEATRLATTWLGHAPRWVTHPTENIVLGLAELTLGEQRLGSLELALAAYNTGVGNVLRAERQSGVNSAPNTPAPPLASISPHLPHRPHRWDARVYAPSVLAGAVLADRHQRGLSLELPNDRPLRLADVPGATPVSR